MNVSSETKVPLHVQTTDAATEIFLVDAHFSRKHKAVGELRTVVVPGIYKLRFRAAQTQIDRLIEIPSEGSPPLKEQPVPFTTAIPLDDTAYALPHHQRMVRETTANPAQRALGGGSKLCLFVRDPTDQGDGQLWSGLSVHRLDGGRIADASDLQPAPTAGIAALSLDLDPGTCRVRLAPANAPEHEIFVPVTRGWQTQVFILGDEPSGAAQRQRTPRLTDASIQMARLGAEFDPSDPRLRLAELLRYGLESGRPILTDAGLAQVLDSQGANPLLDIFAAHLLIRKHPINQSAIEQIAERLTRFVGELPDVAALLLRPGIGKPPRGLRFATPPLLRSSWNLIVTGSRRRMSLVPQDSLTAEVGEGLMTHPLWLVNGVVDSSSKKTRDVMSFAEASRLLNRLIAIRPDQLETKLRHRIEQVMAEASPLERSLLNTTLLQGQSLRADIKGRSAYPLSKALKEIQVPRNSIARSARRLKEKLGF